MSRKNFWAGIGLSVGALGTSLIIFQMKRKQDHWQIWQSVLEEYYGGDRSRQLIAQAQARWRSLCRAAQPPADPALQKHLYFQVLPGLAMYRTLLWEKRLMPDSEARQSAIEEINQLFRAQTFQQIGWTLKPFHWFPNSWFIFRLGMRLRLRAFPQAGWKSLIIEDSDQRIAMETYHCFKHQMLTAYGAPELTASYCATDDYMAELFPRTIKFMRAPTLGEGGDCCQFTYEFIPNS